MHLLLLRLLALLPRLLGGLARRRMPCALAALPAVAALAEAAGPLLAARRGGGGGGPEAAGGGADEGDEGWGAVEEMQGQVVGAVVNFAREVHDRVLFAELPPLPPPAAEGESPAALCPERRRAVRWLLRLLGALGPAWEGPPAGPGGQEAVAAAQAAAVRLPGTGARLAAGAARSRALGEVVLGGGDPGELVGGPAGVLLELLMRHGVGSWGQLGGVSAPPQGRGAGGGEGSEGGVGSEEEEEEVEEDGEEAPGGWELVRAGAATALWLDLSQHLVAQQRHRRSMQQQEGPGQGMGGDAAPAPPRLVFAPPALRRDEDGGCSGLQVRGLAACAVKKCGTQYPHYTCRRTDGHRLPHVCLPYTLLNSLAGSVCYILPFACGPMPQP